MSWLEIDYFSHYLEGRANRTVELNLSDYNQLMNTFNYWNEIEKLADENPVIKHQLDELIAAVILVKSGD